VPLDHPWLSLLCITMSGGQACPSKRRQSGGAAIARLAGETSDNMKKQNDGKWACVPRRVSFPSSLCVPGGHGPDVRSHTNTGTGGRKGACRACEGARIIMRECGCIDLADRSAAVLFSCTVFLCAESALFSFCRHLVAASQRGRSSQVGESCHRPGAVALRFWLLYLPHAGHLHFLSC